MMTRHQGIVSTLVIAGMMTAVWLGAWNDSRRQEELIVTTKQQLLNEVELAKRNQDAQQIEIERLQQELAQLRADLSALQVK